MPNEAHLRISDESCGVADGNRSLTMASSYYRHLQGLLCWYYALKRYVYEWHDAPMIHDRVERMDENGPPACTVPCSICASSSEEHLWVKDQYINSQPFSPFSSSSHRHSLFL